MPPSSITASAWYSAAWLDAIFESSWAYFRIADYEKALGNWVTLHAPFFANEYFPESLILKAVTYYENCRYPESLGMLTEFESQYGPLRDELEKLTKDAKTPDDYYALLKRLESTKNASALTVRLVKLAKSDLTLTQMTASAAEVEKRRSALRKPPVRCPAVRCRRNSSPRPANAARRWPPQPAPLPAPSSRVNGMS